MKKISETGKDECRHCNNHVSWSTEHERKFDIKEAKLCVVISYQIQKRKPSTIWYKHNFHFYPYAHHPLVPYQNQTESYQSNGVFVAFVFVCFTDTQVNTKSKGWIEKLAVPHHKNIFPKKLKTWTFWTQLNWPNWSKVWVDRKPSWVCKKCMRRAVQYKCKKESVGLNPNRI